MSRKVSKGAADREIEEAFAAARTGGTRADQERFMGVLAGYREAFLRTLRSRWKFSWADAEDGVAGMLAEVWEQLTAGKLVGPAKSWFGMLLHRARGHADWRRPGEAHVRTWNDLAEDEIKEPIDSRPSPEREVEVRDHFHQMVAKAAKRWSDQQKQVFWAWAHGLTHAEIAEAIRITKGSSRVLLARAVKALREENPEEVVNKRPRRVA